MFAPRSSHKGPATKTVYSQAIAGTSIFRAETSPIQQSYDEETGQMFTEFSVPAPKKQHSDWIAEFKTPSLFRKVPKPNEQGARSLFNMAKNKTARHFRQMGSNHFVGVPWDFAQEVYEEVINSHGESLHTWRILAENYSYAFEMGLPNYRYKLDIKNPSLPFYKYFKGLTSPHSHWLTCLRVSPKRFQPNDLIDISAITNLSILDLSDSSSQVLTHLTPSPFDARILRTWASLAHSTTRHFQHLRVLLLGWQDTLQPTWLFRYLDAFPSLHILIVTDCPHLHQRNRSDWESPAHDHGWTARRAKHSAKSLRPILDDKTFYLGAVSGLFYESEDALDTSKYAHDIGLKEKVLARRPLLEAWMGNPKVWTHIIDDFPGTRTVWFDKVSKPKVELRAEMVKELNLFAEEMSDNVKQPRGLVEQSKGAAELSKRIRDVVHASPDKAMASPPRKKSGAPTKTEGTSTSGNAAPIWPGPVPKSIKVLHADVGQWERPKGAETHAVSAAVAPAGAPVGAINGVSKGPETKPRNPGTRKQGKGKGSVADMLKGFGVETMPLSTVRKD